MEQHNAWDLRRYWNRLEGCKPDEFVEMLPGFLMPPWEDICIDLDWRMFSVENAFTQKHHGHAGVYRLVGFANDESLKCPAAISRLDGLDKTATLYIGEAGWLHERLNQLRRSLHREETHGAGRAWRSSKVLQSKFPKTKLGIAILSHSGSIRRRIESDLIQAYLHTYGDTPPLNYSF